MEKQIDLLCLEGISVTHNAPLSPENVESIRQRIRNYRNFYFNKYQVPKSEIFYSAVVSAHRLMELCSSDNYVRIYISKNSADNNNISDFNFIIMPADDNGDTALNGKSTNREAFLDLCCCRCPPCQGDGADGN